MMKVSRLNFSFHVTVFSSREDRAAFDRSSERSQRGGTRRRGRRNRLPFTPFSDPLEQQIDASCPKTVLTGIVCP